MPGTLPVSAYCQNCQLLHEAAGREGQLTPQLAIQSAYWPKSEGLPSDGQKPDEV
jgi:hypothetical protein